MRTAARPTALALSSICTQSKRTGGARTPTHRQHGEWTRQWANCSANRRVRRRFPAHAVRDTGTPPPCALRYRCGTTMTTPRGSASPSGSTTMGKRRTFRSSSIMVSCDCRSWSCFRPKTLRRVRWICGLQRASRISHARVRASSMRAEHWSRADRSPDTHARDRALLIGDTPVGTTRDAAIRVRRRGPSQQARLAATPLGTVVKARRRPAGCL